MEYLNELIEFPIEIINNKKKYFCLIRKSFVPATPEEKVRQNFLKYLIDEKKFPLDRIKVEESLAHYGKGKGRVDILILDQFDRPFIIYECKKEYELLTDEVLEQAIYYFNKLDITDYLGIVIGINLFLVTHQQNNTNPLILIEQANYHTLINGEIIIINSNQQIWQRNNWRNPIKKELINDLIGQGIIGNGTNKKYHSFLINLDGWLLDTDDVLEHDKFQDLGIKLTKFGSAGGGFFSKEYRSFLINDHNEKPIVCIALSSIRSSSNVKFGTCIYVGVESVKNKNSSLQMRINKSVSINNNKVIITHNGSITVGKLGSAKRSELINFIKERKPNLLCENKIVLGEFDESEEINSKNVKFFISNIIDYALIRNEFREYKKRISLF